MRSTLSCSQKSLRHYRESWRVKSSRKAPYISQVGVRLPRRLCEGVVLMLAGPGGKGSIC